MVIRISTEQLNVNDVMNNEPPLVLISKLLLIVYEAATSWNTEGVREIRKKDEERSSETSQEMEEREPQ